MRRRKNLPAIVTRKCRRGCGAIVTGLSRPIHGTQADYDKYHHICDGCLTDDERRDMAGPMLMRTARNIQGQAKP